MHAVPASPSHPTGPRLGRRVLGLVGRLVALALVISAGLAGWLAADLFVVAEPARWGVVPAAGDGLPAEHLEAVDLPRAFRLDHSGDAFGRQAESQWFDLDADVIATQSGTFHREFHAGRGFELGDDGAWTEMVPDAARFTRRVVSGGAGPFLLTDVVPPASLPHVTIESDKMVAGVDGGELRRLTLSFDMANFDPVAVVVCSIHTPVESLRQTWTIDVAADGLVRRLEQGDVVRTWTPLSEPIALESPLALDVAADWATGAGAPPPAGAGP